MMLVYMFRRHRIGDMLDLKNKEVEIEHAHSKTLDALASAKESAHNLKQVLEANHITIKISKAIGNKNEPANLRQRS